VSVINQVSEIIYMTISSTRQTLYAFHHRVMQCFAKYYTLTLYRIVVVLSTKRSVRAPCHKALFISS